jgi:hypothetical protein
MLIPLQAGSTIINLVILLEVSDPVKARVGCVPDLRDVAAKGGVKDSPTSIT